MRVPRLHLITDPTVRSLDETLELLPHLLQAGVEAVHLRAREIPAGSLMERARAFRRAVVPPAMFLVNDRLDVALVCEADGVQLPERGLPVPIARRLLGGGRLIGRSVHSVEAARQAEAEGCDFVLFGHVFPTESKAGAPARGLDLLGAIAAQVRVPVIAIGGIVPELVESVLAAGADGIAVIRGILAAPDPVAAVREFRQALARDR